jgi:hypothetical protein
MTERGAMIVFVAGLILTLGGVGGVENSMDNEQLIGSLLIAVLGLLAMYAGSLGFRNSKFYE